MRIEARTCRAVSSHGAKRGDGFALLEVIVFLAAVTAIVAVAIPTLGKSDRQDSADEAIREMDAIEQAIVTYFRDVEAYPATLDDLVTKPAGATSWMGPYVRKDFADREAAQDGWKYDPWRSAYDLVTVSATVRELRSRGPNREDDGGAGDDLVRTIDANPILWVVTKQEMWTVNNAIATYNATEAPPWLSHEYTAALNKLEAKGLLPQGSAPKFRYRYDAWGQWYFTIGSPPTAVGTNGPP
jgi:general secretion pathway protein G